jgi:hypothetical protein
LLHFGEIAQKKQGSLTESSGCFPSFFIFCKGENPLKRNLLISFWLICIGMLPAHAVIISGVVKDSATGTPITTAIVSLRAWGAGATSTARVKITTNASGAYSLTWDTTGAVDLRARDTTGTYVTKDDSIMFSGTDPITVDLPMVKTLKGSVSGTVTSAAASGTPVANAIVTFIATAISPTPIPPVIDTTGADGKYVVNDVPATGKYTISVKAPGFSILSDSVTISTASAVVKDIQLSPAVYSALSGIVGNVAASGAPIAKATVTIVRFAGMTAITKVDTTQTDGKYAFDSVITGKYYLSVKAPGFVTASDSAVLSDATPVTKDIKLNPGVYGFLSGVISDASASDAPLANAVIVVAQGMTVKIDTSGADGKYSFDSLLTGKYMIRITATGFVAMNDSAVLSDTAHVSKNIKLSKTAVMWQVKNRKALSTAPAASLIGNNALLVTSGGFATVSLQDMCGRTVRSWSLEGQAASQVLSLKKGLASGFYTVNIIQNNSVYHNRIVMP